MEPELREHNFNFPMSSELNLYYCGKRDHSRNHTYGPMIRTHFLIVFVREGQATLHGSEHDTRLNANDLLVMFPGERIHYTTDPDIPWSVSWVGVYGPLVWEYLTRLGISAEAPVFHVSNPQEIDGIMEQIFSFSQEQTLSAKTHCISLIYDFFTALFRNAVVRENRDPVQEAIHFIQYNFDKDISVKSLSEALYLNPSYLARIFRRETGLSPKEFIDRERIKKACYILRSTEAPIREVAASVGISDQLYFSRLFRRKTGQSPSEYRSHPFDAEIEQEKAERNDWRI